MRWRAGLWVLIAVCFMGVSPACARGLPNIVVYLSDDHSQYDSSLYGNDNIPTPNFEKMAAEGMVFTHAFVASPSCAPSRAAMLTGLMPARNGAERNHTFPRKGTRSLVNDLKARGYEVVAFGKVAHANKPVFGFDHISKPSSIPQLRKNVAAYLARRKSDQPLCLFVGTSNPHVAWPEPFSFDPAEVEFPPIHLDTPETRRHRAAYYEEIRELDAYLGELRTLAYEKLGDDVLFIHSSDHGSQWPFGKWTLYDYGTRVPLIVSWKGRVKPNTKANAMVSWVDLLPTLIEAAGGRPPQNIDGKSFLPVLKGETHEHRDRIFTTHSGDGNNGVFRNVYPIRSVRTREWKLIHNVHPEFAFCTHSDLDRKDLAGAYWTQWVELAKTDARAKAIVDRYYQHPEYELYHVSQDKWEQHNLIDDPAHAELVAQLKKELQAWIKSQGDQLKVYGPPRPLDKPKTWHPDYFGTRVIKQ